MAGLADIFGEGDSAQQFLLWNVGSAVVSAVLAPVLTALQQSVWKVAVDSAGGELFQALSPEALANAVVRNFVDQAAAADQATNSGTSASDFQTLVDLAGDAPGPSALAEALRRGIIDENGTGADATSFVQGIAEGNLKDKWSDVIRQLAVQWPTPADALQAVLQGQVDDATGQQLYELFGGDPDYYTLLFNTRGNAPTPVEALQMMNRGIIPATGQGAGVVSFQQAFLEGPWRNKWEPAFAALGVYLPPPRTVTALEREGVLTPEEAAAYYADHGMDSTLTAAYARSASIDKVAGSKLLNEGLVLELYIVGGLTADQATVYLNDLGYSDDEAAYVLQTRELQQEVSALRSAVAKVGSLYVAHKVTRPGAVTALGELGITTAGQTRLMATWDVESTANVKLLTENDIAQAFHYGVMDQATAQGYLVELGLSAYDAWVKLSNVNNAPLPDEPPSAVTPPAVIP